MFFCFFVEHGFVRRVTTVTILPSTLFNERSFARCKLGVLVSAGAGGRCLRVADRISPHRGGVQHDDVGDDPQARRLYVSQSLRAFPRMRASLGLNFAPPEIGLEPDSLEEKSTQSLRQTQDFGECPTENQILSVRRNVTGFEQGSILSQNPLDPVEAGIRPEH
jgi:hypothetical protein